MVSARSIGPRSAIPARRSAGCGRRASSPRSPSSLTARRSWQGSARRAFSSSRAAQACCAGLSWRGRGAGPSRGPGRPRPPPPLALALPGPCLCCAAPLPVEGGDVGPFEACGESGAKRAGPLVGPAMRELLIADVRALHRVPAALAERLMTAIHLAQNRAVISKPEGDPLRDLGGGLAACLSFSSFAGLWRGGALALVGPPGVGKTTLAGKLAAPARRSRPILLNTDAARAR